MDQVGHMTAANVRAAADLAAVRRVIDRDIRPYIQADGGDIELLALEGNTVRVRLSGACNTCPSSPETLRLGVQNRLQEKVSPELVVVGA
jgi:NifU-like protein